MNRKYIVTITPPTPNGDLHLGHLSGPFLASDVCARTLKQQGHDVVLLCYSDDYQSYMRRKASQLRREPFALARFNSKQIQLSLEAVNIECDHFLQAGTSKAFKENATYYYRLVKNSNQLSKEATKVFHCDACKVYGYEGLGRTHCNWCGASSDASQCEDCARAPDIDQIDHMTCMLCLKPMQATSVSRFNWHLGRNFARLRKHYEGAPMRPALRGYLDEMLQNDSSKWGITRPGDAGLNLGDQDEALLGQPVHSWFMGLAGYRAALTEYLADHPERGEFAQWWNQDAQLVHFLGFDCSYSHALAYAALQVLDQGAPAPGICLTNQFLKLDGQDFSTSRGHAVWIREIAGQHPIDAIRLFTSLYAPEQASDNFDRAQFEAWRKAVFDKLVTDYCRDLQSPCTGTAPDVVALKKAMGQANWDHAASLQHFSIVGMAKATMEALGYINQVQDLAVRCAAWAVFADMVAPLCPHMADELKGLLKSLPANELLA